MSKRETPHICSVSVNRRSSANPRGLLCPSVDKRPQFRNAKANSGDRLMFCRSPIMDIFLDDTLSNASFGQQWIQKPDNAVTGDIVEKA